MRSRFGLFIGSNARWTLELGNLSSAVQRLDLAAKRGNALEDLNQDHFTTSQIDGCEPHLVIEVVPALVSDSSKTKSLKPGVKLWLLAAPEPSY